MILAGEQQVVHLPEPALIGSRFRCFGGELRLRVNVVQRQMAPDVTDVAVIGQEFTHDRLGLTAVRALEIAVLDDGHGRLARAADVVVVGIDGCGEVDDRLGGAEQGAGAHRLRQQQRDPEDRP